MVYPPTPPIPHPLPVGDQGSRLFQLSDQAIKRSRSKNGPDQILILVVGVSTAGILVTTPCRLEELLSEVGRNRNKKIHQQSIPDNTNLTHICSHQM